MALCNPKWTQMNYDPNITEITHNMVGHTIANATIVRLLDTKPEMLETNIKMSG